MTQAAIGGPAQTTYRVTSRQGVSGRDAQRVFVVSDGRPQEGGPQQAVYYVSDAEIAAGDFVISGNKPIPIVEVGATGAEYPPIAVYVVTANSESDFPPQPGPTPPPSGPVPLLDLDASNLSLADNARVSTFSNAGSIVGTFTAVADARPTYHTGAGTPYITIDGIQNWMLGDAAFTTALDNLDSFTLYYVLKSQATLGHIDLLMKIYDPGNSDVGWEFDEIYGFTEDAGGNNYTGGGQIYAYDGTPIHILRFDVTRNSLAMTINGDGHNFSDSGSGTPVASYATTEPVRLGIMGVGLDQPGWWPLISCDIYRVLMYSPALSVDDNATVLGDLMSAFNVATPQEPLYVSSVVTDATTIDVTFSTGMYSKAISNSGGAVKINGSYAGLAGAALLSPTVVRYTSNDAIAHGDTVTWEYTANPVSPLVTAAVGWPLATVAPQTVTNPL